MARATGTLLAHLEIRRFPLEPQVAGGGAKAHDTLILLACLLSVWIVWYVHLLPFNLDY